MIATTGLQTLDEKTLQPVETRMESALDVRSRVGLFIEADNSRAWKRATAKGLVDGNPPYSRAKQVEAGRADMCNVNWRIAEAYLAAAWGAFYDLFSESATYAVCASEHGSGQQQADWSAIITEEFDKALKEDRYFDYEMQNSIYDMVLYGHGPLMFNGKLDWRSRFSPAGNFYVPDMAKSKTEDWEEAALRNWCTPHDLFNKIRHEQAAAAEGWQVEQVKQSIMFSHPKTSEGGTYQNWEWHQQRIKNSSFWYSSEANAIHLAHYWFREFPQEQEELGRITHCIVDLGYDGQGENQFLFRHTRRFKGFDEIVHPMYYDNLGGGDHHSVTGMGVKMFSAMSYQNKLICNLSDKTFAPKMLFKPSSAMAEEQFNLASFGDYGRIPAGFDFVQVPFQGILEDGISFNREISGLIASNLSQYRQELQKDGNPVTAKQIDYEASQQARLAKTQLNHYYNQLDWLYAEMFRRISNLNMPDGLPGSAIARRFQKACKDRKVPPIALRKCHVAASRIVGQGNQFLRQQTLANMLGIITRLPEEGQERLIRDFIAAQCGYIMVNRYAPERDKGKMPSDHEMLATLQVAAAKEGVPPVVTDTQNHVVYAQTFIMASTQALNSVQKGADPHAALALLETLGPSIHKHLETFKDDQTRAEIYKALSAQFAQISQFTDQLHKKVQAAAQKQQQRRQELQQRQQQQLSDQALKARELDGKQAISERKARGNAALRQWTQQQNMRMKGEAHRQDLALNDAKTAAEIVRKKHSAFSE